MAYVAGDFLVEVRGTTTGGEIWSNTWGFTGVTTSTEEQDVVTALHSFYNDMAAVCSNEWTAQVATGRNLFANTSDDYDFEEIVGTLTGNNLPSQCAIRVSLTAEGNVQGGPFLTGFTVAALDASGLIASGTSSVIVTEVDELNTLVLAAGGFLAIHRPTVLSMSTVTKARVGQRFDIIRKRANDILEAYTVVSL